MFNVVLVEPEIPPNTGNIGRLCLATGSTLHLVEPLGFEINDRQLQRAGLDYWKEVDVRIWASFSELRAAQAADAHYFFLTTKTKRPYFAERFKPGDFLVFGRETKGLPESLLQTNVERLLTIPMRSTRSLNLSTAVAIVLFEAVRQNATLNL
ncbi:MAG: tRNA (cytidine(34)-2'-O)-methyltransferase [Verrucomicrobiota bacterium]|nr:tRNA (cytidine(34)-2'-O)-methyltransferase [Chthoniobacterales bacterium]MBA3763082.1 tRNA (cytidine(34)-2'-O)-methyltransferase [Chthoniobacterales bacterium]MDQ3313567.1 tRNA (cytidine(34)-2'-O)-methyltransferase [Verrucomicrobiota bacterium]